MAIKIGGVTVLDDVKKLTNITGIDVPTAAVIQPTHRVSETAPATPFDNQVWIDQSGSQRLYYNDGNSSAWVELTTPGTTDTYVSYDCGDSFPTDVVWTISGGGAVFVPEDVIPGYNDFVLGGIARTELFNEFDQILSLGDSTTAHDILIDFAYDGGVSVN